ncbi:hypothetical protein B0T16DRAFT_402518 [Cercophora newfieldiana]|uniref:MYND-type domain-containing protein n=1 Tax=Cercophora newfieldiana TaxID=92897 RepID=A0AA39YSH5_9PEZI|nr:hypothetical protein B0T16DRAFT_402518 [Cercophora newfieldiana]
MTTHRGVVQLPPLDKQRGALHPSRAFFLLPGGAVSLPLKNVNFPILSQPNSAMACAKCQKPTDSARRCPKCGVTEYCSRSCQRGHLKVHKDVCGTGADGAPAREDTGPRITTERHTGQTLNPPKGLDGPITKPFTKLNDDTWLHDRPEKDVYRLLIDAYRMKMADQNKFEGIVDADNVYGGAADSAAGFERFLGLVEAPRKRNLLPPWWNEEHKQKCIELGRAAPGDWYSLAKTVEKQGVIDHYGDPRFPMQLRMFAEVIYERGPGGPGGNDSTGVRMMMAATEAGTLPRNSTARTVDMNTGRMSRWM